MTIIRLGIWSLVLIMVVYVFTETAPDSPVAEIITGELLALLTKISFGIVALGLVVGLIEKLWGMRRRKCKTCGRPIPSTAIYCRLHLKEVLEEEDLLTRRTMDTKLPDDIGR